MDDRLLLAIETSGRIGSVAAGIGNEMSVERELGTEGRRHAQTLLAEIVDALGEIDRRPADIDAVVVSTGPGSFTGLRVGVVAAKTIAYARSCPLVAVETFDAVASRVASRLDDLEKFFVFDDAQRGDLFVTEYRVAEGGAEPVQSIEVVNAAEWIAARSSEDVVTGSGCQRFGSELADRCRLLDEEFWIPRAADVWALGLRKLLAGETVDPVALEPAYRRRSSAEVKWDERHAATRSS